MGCGSSKGAKRVSSLNEVIIVCSSSDRPILHVHAWHLSHKKWYDLSTNIPKAREQFAAIAAGSNIVVTGGQLSSFDVLPETLIYNSLTNKWMKGPNLNTARRRHGSVEVEGDVFVLGGDTSRSLLDSVEMLNFDRGRWETVGNLAEVVADPVAISIGNRILLIGGNKSSFTRSHSSCRDIHCFDVETKSASIFEFNFGNVISGTLVSEVIYLITDNFGTMELQLVSVKGEDDHLELPKHRVFKLPRDIRLRSKTQFVVADGVGFFFSNSSTRLISLDAEETDKVVLPTIPGSVSDVWAGFTMLVGERSLH